MFGHTRLMIGAGKGRTRCAYVDGLYGAILVGRTVPNLPLGEPHPTREIILPIAWTLPNGLQLNNIPSITLNGQLMDLHAATHRRAEFDNQGRSGVVLASIKCPEGETGELVFDGSAGGTVTWFIPVYRAINMRSRTPAAANADSRISTGALTFNQTVLEGGFQLATFFTRWIAPVTFEGMTPSFSSANFATGVAELQPASIRTIRGEFTNDYAHVGVAGSWY